MKTLKHLIMTIMTTMLLMGGLYSMDTKNKKIVSLTLSDMENLSNWEGEFTQSNDHVQGSHSMQVDLRSGKEYILNLKNFAEILEKSGHEVGDFDAIKFNYKVSGGKLLYNTIIRAWPFLGGCRLMYYELKPDFAIKPGWHEFTGILRDHEGIFPVELDQQKEFKILVQGESGKKVKLLIDNIRLVKRPFTVGCMVNNRFLDFGFRTDFPDGAVEYTYKLKVHNHLDIPIKVKLKLSKLKDFNIVSGVKQDLDIKPLSTVVFSVKIRLDAEKRKTMQPLSYEICHANFSIPGLNDSQFNVDLIPAVPYKIKKPHPYWATTRNRIKTIKKWRKKWGWAENAVKMVLKRADFAMKIPQELPKCSLLKDTPESRVCPKCKTKTKLYKFKDPCMLYRYQCLNCGEFLSPKYAYDFKYDGARWRPKDNKSPGHAIVLSQSGNIVDLALAYQLTGDAKYSRRVTDVIKKYVKIIPDYPLYWQMVLNNKNAPVVADFFQNYEWMSNISMALDMTWDSGCLSKQEKQDLLQNILIPMLLQRMRVYNYLVLRRNFGAGIALMADNAPLAALLLNGTAGIRKFIDDQVHPDGMGYMVPGYNKLLIFLQLMPLLTLYDNVGIDLYNDNVKKSFYAWTMLSDPDGNNLSLGDAGMVDPTHRVIDMFEQGYGKLKNQATENLLRTFQYKKWLNSGQKWEDISRGRSAASASYVLLNGAENIPRGLPQKAKGSDNFPDYGLLIFNQGEGDRQLWLAMPYGAPMGHGMNDKLHFSWWALGQRMTKHSCGRYAGGWGHAVNHNTLIVDQKNMINTPCKLLKFKNNGPVQGAILENSDMYPDTMVRRTIVLYNGIVILYDQFVSEKAHIYDFLYKNFGQLHTELSLKPAKLSFQQEINSFGMIQGYAWLQGIRKGKTDGMFKCYWDHMKQKNVRMNMMQLSFPKNKSELIIAETPVFWPVKGSSAMNAAEYTDELIKKEYPKVRFRPGRDKTTTSIYIPVICSRIKGKKAAFLTLLIPSRGTDSITDFKLLNLKNNDKPISYTEGVAFRFVIDQQAHTVFICPETGIKDFGNGQTRKLFDAAPSF